MMKRIGSIALAAAGLGVVGGCSSWGGAGYHAINEPWTTKKVDEVRLVQVPDVDTLLQTSRVNGSVVLGYTRYTTRAPKASMNDYVYDKFGPIAARNHADFVRWAVNEIEPPIETGEGVFSPGKYEYAAIFYGPLEQPVPVCLSFENKAYAHPQGRRTAFSTRWLNQEGKIDQALVDAIANDAEPIEY